MSREVAGLVLRHRCWVESTGTGSNSNVTDSMLRMAHCISASLEDAGVQQACFCNTESPVKRRQDCSLSKSRSFPSSCSSKRATNGILVRTGSVRFVRTQPLAARLWLTLLLNSFCLQTLAESRSPTHLQQWTFVKPGSRERFK